MAEILIVDDEASVLYMLRELLEERGHTPRLADSGSQAAAWLAAGELDELSLVLTDFAMPGLDGMGLLALLRARLPELPVVLLTARGSERLAVRAIKEGAFDYLPKPFDLDELEGVVARALELSELRRAARRAAAERAMGKPFVGRAPAFRGLIDRALRVAKREVPVLVRGETGSGKELLAALLHAGSPRAHGPLVRFNCAALVAELAESELFGHVRGAFTGAHAAHRGFFAQAHGGTLVLDEVGELPLTLQPKLLRALQSGEIQPVGASKVELVDVRVVACTHRDLSAEVAGGRFRQDLYYRLAVIELRMPSLQERREDIPLLAELFARAAAERFGLEGVRLDPELSQLLAQRVYPGNVRELENLVTRLVALSDGGLIRPSALAEAGTGAVMALASGTFRAQVEGLEQRLLREALAGSGGNQSEAARRLGLSRVTFLDKLKRYGIAP
ncbi:MAG TPA: sigma-54 dependent transcriptional regulator [Polyangiales bacterium]